MSDERTTQGEIIEVPLAVDYRRLLVAFNRVVSLMAEKYGGPDLPDAPDFIAALMGYAVDVSLGITDWASDAAKEEEERIRGLPVTGPVTFLIAPNAGKT